MMTNLFSLFDPCTGNFSLNWMSSMIFLLLMNFDYWLVMNNKNLLLNMMIKFMLSEINPIITKKKSLIIFISIGVFILFNNILGLLPYVFTSPSHMVFSLSMAIPLWMSFYIYSWVNKTNLMFIHLVPSGTPSMIMPFMVIIETISSLIRPGSLAVRLTANMIAGHLLMSLLGESCQLLVTMIFMIIFVMLLIFETAVSIIQSYVFMILMTLYSSET